VPPDAASSCAYAVPTWPFGNDAVVIASVAGAIVTVRLTLAVCGVALESVTLNVSAAAFAAPVGVPLITPVDVFSVKPPGSVPEASAHV